jgi:hypothetical protein
MYNYECFGLFGTDPITRLVSYLTIFVKFFFLCNHLMFYIIIYPSSYYRDATRHLQVALLGSLEVGNADVWVALAILGGIMGYIAKIYFTYVPSNSVKEW